MPCPEGDDCEGVCFGLEKIDSISKCSFDEGLTEFCGRDSRDSYLRRVERSVKAPLTENNRIASQRNYIKPLKALAQDITTHV